MTKVLAVVTFKVFPPQMGGQKGVVLFYKHLKNLLQVSLSVSRNNEDPPNGWDVENVLFENKKMFLNPFILWQLKKMVQQKEIEVIIAEHSYTGWIGWLLRKWTGVPFIIHSHNIEALRFQQMRRSWWRLYARYEKWIHQKSNHNFFISKEDQTYAIQHFGLYPQKCSVVTYGIEAPTSASISKKEWLQAYGLKGTETLFYFNGTLDYKPNLDAVIVLIDNIIPLLQRDLQNFTLVISGNRASAELVQKMRSNHYCLFVSYAQEVSQLYAMADVFINPVVNNSGIKTKVVEAIAAGCHVVTTQSGAWGIYHELCKDQLWVAEDNNWQQFTALMKQASLRPKTMAPKPFYDTYLWNNIAAEAAVIIRRVAHQNAHK